MKNANRLILVCGLGVATAYAGTAAVNPFNPKDLAKNEEVISTSAKVEGPKAVSGREGKVNPMTGKEFTIEELDHEVQVYKRLSEIADYKNRIAGLKSQMSEKEMKPTPPKPVLVEEKKPFKPKKPTSIDSQSTFTPLPSVVLPPQLVGTMQANGKIMAIFAQAGKTEMAGLNEKAFGQLVSQISEDAVQWGGVTLKYPQAGASSITYIDDQKKSFDQNISQLNTNLPGPLVRPGAELNPQIPTTSLNVGR